MPLILELGDVLDAQTGAILLTVDGSARNKRDSARPIRGGKEILGGNISNQFAKRWPEDWEDLQPDIRFPIPLGSSQGIPWDAEKLAIIRSALTDALAIAVRHDAKSLATTALKGGWRLPLADAVDAMCAAYRQAGHVLVHPRSRRMCPPKRALVLLASNQSIDHSASEYPGKLWMASMRIVWMILQASDIG